MKPVFDFHPASREEFDKLWDFNVNTHPEDGRWRVWRAEYAALNALGIAETWVVTADGEPVGEGTILWKPGCSAVNDRLFIADGRTRANLDGLRMRKAYEGKGLMSRLVKHMEATAKERGYGVMTIGVDEKEKRNCLIYDHWGYRTLILKTWEDGEPVLYLSKEL